MLSLLALVLLTSTPAAPPASDGALKASVSSPAVLFDVAHRDVLHTAATLVDRGDASAATGLLVHHARSGALTAAEQVRARSLLVVAARRLDADGDRKAAAAAADLALRLGPADVDDVPDLATIVARYGEALVSDGMMAEARGIGELAHAWDSDNVVAADVDVATAGTDTWTIGHVTLLAGVGLLCVGLSAFVVGHDVERQVRATPHETAVVDALLFRRGVAAAVAWPATTAAVVGSSAGLALIMLDEAAPTPRLPAPFPTIPTIPTGPTGLASEGTEGLTGEKQ